MTLRVFAKIVVAHVSRTVDAAVAPIRVAVDDLSSRVSNLEARGVSSNMIMELSSIKKKV